MLTYQLLVEPPQEERHDREQECLVRQMVVAQIHHATVYAGNFSSVCLWGLQ